LSPEDAPGFSIPARQYFALLGTYLRSHRASMALLGLMVAAGIALQLANPQVIRFFIDAARSQSEMGPLVIAAVLFIGFAVLQQIINVLATILGGQIGWKATNRLRAELARHLLRQDMAFHTEHSPGSLIERVDGDVNALAAFFSSFVLQIAGNVLLMAGVVVLLFREHPLLGITMAVFCAAAIFLIQHIRRFALPAMERARQASADFYGFLGEHLEGTEDTRASGATGYVLNRLYLYGRRILALGIRSVLGFVSIWVTSIVVYAFGTAAALAISAWLWGLGSLSIGTVYLIIFYTELLTMPIERIRGQMEQLQKADASIHRVSELMNTPPAILDGAGVPLPQGPLSVELRDIRFRYETAGKAEDTLSGISFLLAPGRVLGLLGRTGSGKSTLARLLIRFYNPSAGSVYIGGVDIRACTLRELRSRIGYVTQNVELFAGTLRDNLTFYDTGVEDGRILHVFEELGLTDWYESLPRGLDTPLAFGGGGLSAGESQLIACARVFLANPGLVILDEASSRLDRVTEGRLERAIDRLLAGRTCIVIAHRLGTVQRAHQILVLEGGQIAEQGEREALAARPDSRYSALIRTGSEEILA
jgi:ATP-binding cassette, subfamily B, bacterial